MINILNISRNQLYSVPKTFEKLTNLIKLSAHVNLFREFPLQICNLKNLIYLNLSENPIKYIPSEIGNVNVYNFLTYFIS